MSEKIVQLNEEIIKGQLKELVRGSVVETLNEPRHMERDVAGGRGEVAVVVTAAVALTSLATLIAGGLCQGLRLLLQQLVQGFLHAAADQFPDLTLSSARNSRKTYRRIFSAYQREQGRVSCKFNAPDRACRC